MKNKIINYIGNLTLVSIMFNLVLIGVVYEYFFKHVPPDSMAILVLILLRLTEIERK